MRTFHIGGAASGAFKPPEVASRPPARSSTATLRLVQAPEGGNIVLNKNGSIQIHDKEGRELESYTIVIGSVIHVGDGEKVRRARTSRNGTRTTSRSSPRRPARSNSAT